MASIAHCKGLAQVFLFRQYEDYMKRRESADMTPQDVVRHFRSKSNAARSLGVVRRTIQNWCTAKRIPPRTQHWIEFETGGALKAGKQK